MTLPRFAARLLRASCFAPRKSGRGAPPTPPDLRTLLAMISTNAQAIVDATNQLPGAIDSYTAGKITEAETALAAQHAEDLQGIDAALAAVAAKVNPQIAPVADPTAA